MYIFVVNDYLLYSTIHKAPRHTNSVKENGQQQAAARGMTKYNFIVVELLITGSVIYTPQVERLTGLDCWVGDM